MKPALLSNGSPDMLKSATIAAGIAPVLDALFSVDRVGRFKTHPLAYRVFREQWALSPAKIAFVSSNRWDVAGANKAGFQTIWLNRSEQPDEYCDLSPDRIIRSVRVLCD